MTVVQHSITKRRRGYSRRFEDEGSLRSQVRFAGIVAFEPLSIARRSAQKSGHADRHDDGWSERNEDRQHVCVASSLPPQIGVEGVDSDAYRPYGVRYSSVLFSLFCVSVLVGT
jgi:hypothetical protein